MTLAATAVLSLTVPPFVGTLVAAPVIRPFLVRRGLMDIPNHRSSHVTATPRGGGLACLFGLVAGVLTQWAAHTPFVPPLALVPILLVAAIGFVDDRRSIPVLPRLLGQAVCGIALGLTIGGWAILVGALAMVLSVNAVNFMDGINGITCLTVAAWGITAAVLGGSDHPSLTFLGLSAVGVCLGFLPWNAPGARMFLGDVGSYLLGGLVASGWLIGAADGVDMAVLGAPLFLYAFDTGFTVVRRARARATVFEAHREHIYQRLTTDGLLPHWAVALLVAGVSAVLVVTWGWCSPPVAIIVTVALLGLYAWLPTALRAGLPAEHSA